MSGETRPPEPSPQTVALEQIDSAPFQIRLSIDEERLRQLATSMDERGLLQPILVRRKADRLEVVAGERRFRAAKLLRWSAIACRVTECSDVDADVDKIVENEQRADANPLERARAFAHLRDQYKMDQEEIARRVGVHKSVVSRALALLRQPAEIQTLVAEESITPAHLRSLTAVADESKRVELAAQAAKERLTSEETRRRAYEAARSAGATSNEDALASATTEVPQASALKQPAEIQKTVMLNGSRASPPRPAEATAKPSFEVQKKITDETSTPAPPRAPDAIEEPAGELQTAVAESRSVERQAPDALGLQRQRIEQRIASWCIAVGSAVRGWPNAVWDFYERMTDVAFWWRVGKCVLKFLARFIPGREPEPSRLSKAIKAAFRADLEAANSETKKPRPPKDT